MGIFGWQPRNLPQKDKNVTFCAICAGGSTQTIGSRLEKDGGSH